MAPRTIHQIIRDQWEADIVRKLDGLIHELWKQDLQPDISLEHLTTLFVERFATVYGCKALPLKGKFPNKELVFYPATNPKDSTQQ